MIKVLGLALYGPQAASTRYRLTQYAPGLRAEGIDLQILPLLDDDYLKTTFAGERYSLPNLVKAYASRLALLADQTRYDLAIIQVEMFPFLPGAIESRLLRIPYIYDFDDAFFLKYHHERFKAISFLLKEKFTPVISRAAAVTAGNHFLAAHAQRLNAATSYLPTVVDTNRYYCSGAQDDVFTVGWVGSPSTSVYLKELAAPLAQLGREGPVRFIVVGGSCAAIEGVDVVNLPWAEATEVSLINRFDVGVMPLFDDEWARGKCAFKLIQYMACGVPVIASPVGANIDVVDETCGFFAKNSAEWLEKLRWMRGDASLRRIMGLAARRRIERFYSLDRNLPIMSDVIRRVAGQ